MSKSKSKKMLREITDMDGNSVSSNVGDVTIKVNKDLLRILDLANLATPKVSLDGATSSDMDAYVGQDGDMSLLPAADGSTGTLDMGVDDNGALTVDDASSDFDDMDDFDRIDRSIDSEYGDLERQLVGDDYARDIDEFDDELDTTTDVDDVLDPEMEDELDDLGAYDDYYESIENKKDFNKKLEESARPRKDEQMDNFISFIKEMDEKSSIDRIDSYSKSEMKKVVKERVMNRPNPKYFTQNSLLNLDKYASSDSNQMYKKQGDNPIIAESRKSKRK